MNGWIKLHRKLLTWEWYNDSKMVHLFLHLLLSANHDEKKHQGITIKRGEVKTGRIKLSSETGISQQSIRTCLERLLATNEITIKSTNKYSLITILKYDSYQIEDTIQPSNQPAIQPTTNQQLTTNKNVKNNKEEKKGEIPTVDDFISYANDRGYSEHIAEKAWHTYKNSDWKDSKGNEVKNWKNKLNNVWFRPEHKVKKTEYFEGTKIPKNHFQL